MEAYQQRVMDERNELSSKIDKLHTFIYGEDALKFRTLSGSEQDRLTRQHHHMQEYHAVLCERIVAWTELG